MNQNEKFMRLAIHAAETSAGISSPNPHVGAVLVKNGIVVATGSTQFCGGDHAEIVALKKAGEKARDAELYVTLEPCCHYGKTPPCTDAIIKAGIKKVIVGITDPNPLVNGKGLKILQNNGIEVVSDILSEEISKQLEIFVFWKKNNRPFITMKNAVTLDGKIASETGDSKWITGELAREQVHLLRSRNDAVLTGINTVLADDPMLNVRLKDVSKSPIRVILDPNLLIPEKSKIVHTAQDYKTIVFYSNNGELLEKIDRLTNHGIQCIPVEGEDEKLDLQAVLTTLSEMSVSSLMIEAGKNINTAFLKEKLVNKIYYYIAPKIIGGSYSVFSDLGLDSMSEAITLNEKKIEIIGDDILVSGYVCYHW